LIIKDTIITETRENLDHIISETILSKKPVSFQRNFHSLQENDKKNLSVDLINSVVDSIKEKSNNIKMEEIEKTKGDISRIKNFEDIKDSVRFLTKLYNIENNAPDIIPNLNQALINLDKYKKEFQEAYRQDNFLLKTYYESVVFSLIFSITYLVTNAIKYKQDKAGNLIMSFEDDLEKGTDTNYTFNSVRKFNKYIEDGKFEKFTNKSLDNENFFAAVGAGLSIIILTFFFVWTIRQIIYFVYFTRAKVSDYLNSIANYVELNKESISSDDDAKEKQAKLASKLRDVADKIDVQKRKGNAEAKKEIEDDTDGDSTNIDLNSGIL
jgi:hypothetical protein